MTPANDNAAPVDATRIADMGPEWEVDRVGRYPRIRRAVPIAPGRFRVAVDSLGLPRKQRGVAAVLLREWDRQRSRGVDHIAISVREICRRSGASAPTVEATLRCLRSAGIVVDATSHSGAAVKRRRIDEAALMAVGAAQKGRAQ